MWKIMIDYIFLQIEELSVSYEPKRDEISTKNHVRQKLW